jgi:multiple sugar transport system substrate-binding protein
MVATGQRFSETHPDINIEWSKRSLQKFADEHIEKLALRYDLLVIDHPWAGYAADSGIIQPLDQCMPSSFLLDQAVHSVGKSYESYHFGGHQFALPIDAATPVASSRPDILHQMDEVLPETFDDLIRLAEKGGVTMPGIAIDTLMNFYMMCCGLGEDPCQSPECVVEEKTGVKALEMLKELSDRLNPEFFNWNPIQVHEAMSGRDDLAYCPWAYGYANYSRKGYARNILFFHDLIDLDNNRPFRSTLGGTGLAISAHCKHMNQAAEYAMYVSSPEVQRTLYFDSGGQPGHKKAWEDDHVNNLSCQFFKSTISTLEHAFLRPRYNGYMHFQDNAGGIIRDYIMKGGIKEEDVLASLNTIYMESKNQA